MRISSPTTRHANPSATRRSATGALAAASLAIPALLAGTGISAAAPLAGAATHKPTTHKPTTTISAYVMAWRQSGTTLLIAYRAKENVAGAHVASCAVDAKPSVKVPKPGYLSFPPQRVVLRRLSSRFSYIGDFGLPATPAAVTVLKVWVTCS